MTEAEALAIAMKAIVSAFVTATPAPAPAPPPPALTPKRKPRRKKPVASRPLTMDDVPPMPRFDLPLSPEPDESPDAPPPVTVAELEAILNGSRPPAGQYAREEQEDVGGGWLGPQ